LFLSAFLSPVLSSRRMSDITSFFKPADGTKKKAATTASPAKPTAASRKRKAEEDTATAPTEEAPASAAAAAAAPAAAAEQDEEFMRDASPTLAAVAKAGGSGVAELSDDQKAKIASNKAAALAKKQKLADGSAAPGAAHTADLEAALETMIPASWSIHLAPEFKKPYWPQIGKFLAEEAKKKTEIFPPRHQIFRALELCPFETTKVVILGQDPYHDNGQAEGLCFSVPPDVKKVPPSLVNIYKELESDLGKEKFKRPKHGNLVKWAQQGVLLLNTGLTVTAHKANSHKGVGWHSFTDAVIKAVSKDLKGVVFILWGKPAQDKAKFIDESKHYVLKSAHPSPLSAHNGFFGNKHFSKTNEKLAKQGKTPIDWQV
jgi:uracil-DNA glycosylase